MKPSHLSHNTSHCLFKTRQSNGDSKCSMLIATTCTDGGDVDSTLYDPGSIRDNLYWETAIALKILSQFKAG